MDEAVEKTLKREFGAEEDCIERISDLTSWFFRGWHGYFKEHVRPGL
ncbi:hypothetical protein ACFW6S_36360 [Streptomyces sp. NPDC058740]